MSFRSEGFELLSPKRSHSFCLLTYTTECLVVVIATQVVQPGIKRFEFSVLAASGLLANARE